MAWRVDDLGREGIASPKQFDVYETSLLCLVGLHSIERLFKPIEIYVDYLN